MNCPECEQEAMWIETCKVCGSVMCDNCCDQEDSDVCQCCGEDLADE